MPNPVSVGLAGGAAVPTLLCESSENFKAYAVAGHRHLPEIRQGLSTVAAAPVQLTFVPHLTPMIRGIHATCYATLTDSGTDLQSLFSQRYQDEYFVDVLDAGEHPETRTVRGTNHCRISVFRPQGADTVVVLSVIDNLGKGAASQGIQNMNLMCDLGETTGLENIAALP